MRNHSTLALLIAAATCQAQSLNNVVITPANPTSCTTLTFNFIGSMPQNANFTSFSPDFDSDSLNVALFAQGGGGGNSNFNQELPGIGPFAAGTYTVCVTFTLNGNLVGTDCQTLVIVPGTDPYAGEYMEHTGLCTGGPTVPLLSFLGGDPDTYGSWIDANNQPVPNGMFVPGQSPEGFYTYQFLVQPPCTSTSQQVLILYASPAADAGLNNTVETCNDQGPTIDLFTQLLGTPDVGGTWSFNGSAHSNIFNPVTDACGTYFYSVPGIGGCPPTVAEIEVDCVNPPNAGNVNANNDTLNLCYNDTMQFLQPLVSGEQQTGIWISPAGFQIGAYNDTINPSLNGSGRYGYVVLGDPCPNDTSFVTIILWGNPDDGCTVGMAGTEDLLARFEVMPNPAQDQVTIEVERTRADGPMLLELLDAHGRIVRSEALNFNGLLARRTLQTGDLVKGAYLVRISSSEGRTTRRLMVR
jgi:hypothetical protein